ncbi:hypothetical protein [Paenibacillus pini]|uniref:Uncharacterized protein n=1 Tax=Paenibacillus pini JCM 16418 TaxID=1236976 RepID=W7YIY2_9BACL|nr:hypothetical protein [Paenibacillus pini]GAF10860.1 hypothetical protein JCM16418_5087 [Paenibacillus pini JCM 16418]
MKFHGQGERLVSVIVDSNLHKLKDSDGNKTVVKTKIVDNIVTIEHCQEITQKLKEHYKIEPKILDIYVDIYSKTEGNEVADFPEELLLDKKVLYDVGLNRLRIWQDGIFVYENINGDICSDPVALDKKYYPFVPVYKIFAKSELEI